MEEGKETEIQKLLWQPKVTIVKYLPIAGELILKLKRPSASASGLSIYERIEKGNFELLIFELAWDNSDLPYLPLIIDRRNGKVAGIMLLFNELYYHLSKKEQNDIGDLSKHWVMFAFKRRFEAGKTS
ncbi:MAG TPA: hypothetical protein VG603_06335 [Chitinophagales bacterium]|nr:hypothetical protein [Chitinophagales bacterium]